jgi:hypothetical protein
MASYDQIPRPLASMSLAAFGVVALAALFAFDMEAHAGGVAEGLSPFDEVNERILRLKLPESLLAVLDAPLSVGDLEKTADILRAHDAWMQDVLEEYRWTMLYDDTDKAVYEQLLKAHEELQATLADIDAKKIELAKIDALEEKLLRAGVEPEVVRFRIDGLLEHHKIAHLREVRENLTQLYTAAHQMSYLQTHGYVWVGGVAKPIEEVFGIKFAQSDETQVPRRPARAFFEFFKVMNKETGWYPLVTEGHTGDPERPTSGQHESQAHKDGRALDIIPRGAPMEPEKVYRTLIGSKGNEYFKILYEPGSQARAQALIAEWSRRATEEGHFKSLSEAETWFKSHIGHGKYTTGEHFHVVGETGLGKYVDPEGPKRTTVAAR